MSGLINLFVLFLILGVAMGLINAFVPMPRTIKGLLNLLAVVVLVIYAAQFFGLIPQQLPPLRIFQ